LEITMSDVEKIEQEIRRARLFSDKPKCSKDQGSCRPWGDGLTVDGGVKGGDGAKVR
jgi:hypothetical protein